MAFSRNPLSDDQMRQEYRLIQAAQQNPRRFGVLYERYYEQIFLFVYKRVMNEEEAADLTSQVFLKAMTHLKRYTFKGVPFSAWLYRIASNEVNQFFRKSNKQRMISMESLQLKEMAEEAEVETTEDSLQRMVAALSELKEEEVALIEARFFERIPFKEVAVIFGLSESNAKVKVHRLLKKLNKMLQTAPINNISSHG